MPNFSGILLLITIFPAAIIGIAMYLLQAISIYTLSTRCGLNKPYLAFVPVANYYQMGLLADQYERPVKIGKLRYALTPLAVLQCIAAILLMVYSFQFLSEVFAIIPSMETMAQGDMQVFWQAYIKYFMFFSVYFLLAIPSMILTYVALYKIYKMVNPANAALLLILSIFVGGSSVVILFISRNKPLIFPNEQQIWQQNNL
jgi:hypothetical protein